jgi:hypothetical protein
MLGDQICIRVSQKTQHFVCASFSHSLMSLESQYGTKKIFSHQFQIYVKLENCDFSLKDRIFPVFCCIFNPICIRHYLKLLKLSNS